MNDIVELFGQPTSTTAKLPWNEIVREQKCPFVERMCIKTRKSQPELAIGTCSVLYGKHDHPIVICPLRLLQHGRVFVDCLHLLRLHEPGNDVHVVPEMRVPGGSIDYVLVSARDGKVIDLVGIELQTLDTTGTVWPARQHFLSYVGLPVVQEANRKLRSYGMNWKMTAKTILVQLHHKIQTFEGLGKTLVLVVQDYLLDYLRSQFDFSHVQAVRSSDSMHFHVYEMRSEKGGHYLLKLATRLSTDANGIARCLDLQAEPNVSLGQIVQQLESKLCQQTLLRVDDRGHEKTTV